MRTNQMDLMFQEAFTRLTTRAQSLSRLEEPEIIPRPPMAEHLREAELREIDFWERRAVEGFLKGVTGEWATLHALTQYEGTKRRLAI